MTDPVSRSEAASPDAAAPRLMPAQAGRVETGPVQFGDDWPGVFIRGDAAAAHAAMLQDVILRGGSPLARVWLAGLYNTLRSCFVGDSRVSDSRAVFPPIPETTLDRLLRMVPLTGAAPSNDETVERVWQALPEAGREDCGKLTRRQLREALTAAGLLTVVADTADDAAVQPMLFDLGKPLPDGVAHDANGTMPTEMPR